MVIVIHGRRKPDPRPVFSDYYTINPTVSGFNQAAQLTSFFQKFFPISTALYMQPRRSSQILTQYSLVTIP